jgi:hypothetical protein
VNFLFGHLPSPVSFRKFTFEEGNLTDETLSIPPQTDASTATFSISHARDDSIYDIGASVPPQNKHYRNKDEHKATQRKPGTHMQDSLLSFL